jgi:hypothetical protein
VVWKWQGKAFYLCQLCHINKAMDWWKQSSR